MRLFKKAAIVGTGLIGGSLALAIKKSHLAKEVVGVSRHKKSLALARKRGALDKGSQSLEIIKGADLLVLATPVEIMKSEAVKISKLIDKKCIVTDVGSTKQELVSCLEKFFPRYVGSHPLAGSEKRGIFNADKNLFKNSLCILTPTKSSDHAALNKLNSLWKRLGARTVFLKPETHDQILAFVSHLPHLVAFSLINSIPAAHLKFAASGLKDATRIAASDSELWAEIFLSNRKNILKKIDVFQREILEIKSALQRKDKLPLLSILKKAKSKREKLG